MADVVDKETRSRMMAGIRGRDTKPEIEVRKFLHKSGLRFRLSPADMFGKPDIVLPRHKVVVLVHGCYWHRHPGCKFATTPKTNKAFWIKKFDSNVARDNLVKKQLKSLGWKVLIVWECQITQRKLNALSKRIVKMGLE